MVSHRVLYWVSCFFLYIYINDFPSAINKLASSVLFADYTSNIVSNTNPEEFKNSTILVMNEIIEWFKNNLLSLNCNKTTFLQFITKKIRKLHFKSLLQIQ